MEVVLWYLANADGTESRRWYVHLTDFCDEHLIVPLFTFLAERPVTKREVFDGSVYRDPRLDDPSLWDGSRLLEVKRVNPELIRLLATLKAKHLPEVATAWAASPEAQEFYGQGKPELALSETTRMLTELVRLARQAVEKKQDVLQKFWWATA